MSEQDGRQAPALQHPTTSDPEAWKAYWTSQGQPWRTEPEIGTKRQEELAQRRAVIPDIKQGIYPFKDMKLSRADVEWLLATLENGRGPVDWEDKSQRNRKGLDLRGADLSQKDLSGLPLACIQGGLTSDEWLYATDEQRNMSVVQMGKADLVEAQLQGTDLFKAQLQGADLRAAKLQGAHLVKAQLQGADLQRAELDGVGLYKATLSDEKYGSALLTDIRWGEVNLAVVDWTPVKMLGDEQVARQKKDSEGGIKDKRTRLDEYKRAVRASRQLSVVLRNQGLNEDAARFAYRAQLLQRRVFRLQGGIRSFGQYLSSLLLDLLAGYGYKPWRSFLAYLIVITGFATTYFFIGRTVGPVLSPLGSFVFSMTSFHGRGFFPGGIGLDDPLTVLAALEAFVGLLIEVTFIATLTQRLFGR